MIGVLVSEGRTHLKRLLQLLIPLLDYVHENHSFSSMDFLFSMDGYSNLRTRKDEKRSSIMSEKRKLAIRNGTILAKSFFFFLI